MTFSNSNYGTSDNLSSYGDNYFNGQVKGWKKYLNLKNVQRRHILSILAFLGFMNIYAMRANLSVAIIEMTSPRKVIHGNETVVLEPEFEWSKMTQSYILAAFFNGYIFTQIPGSFLAKQYGGTKVFMLGIFGTAVFTILTPPLAKMGKYAIFTARFMEGVCEGVTYPAMHVIWSKWAPYTEKTRLGSFAFSGSYFGTVVSVSLSAYIGEYFGWPAIFFFFGVVALLWCAAWIKFVRENPEDDPHISGDELALIKTSIIPLTNELLNWKDCMTSGPVWAIITAHFCENWGFYTMLTYLPNILKDITHFELETVGTVSAIPYWVMGFTLIFAGVYSDRLIERHNWSVERVRRTFCCFGFVGQAAALIAASFTSSSTPLIIALILSIGLGGFPWSSFSVNHLDIAPQYAGQLMGISNTIATIPGMISPLIVGSVITSGTFVEWSTVFYLTSVIYLFGAAVFFKYVSGDIVPWAKEPNLLTASFSVTD